MPKLFDLAVNNGAFEKLQAELNELKKQAELERENQRKERIRNHRRHHIFSTYEEALDYCIAHPDRSIQWYCSTIEYVPEMKKFRSYEQDFGIDGVIPRDVIRYYTRDEMLRNNDEHIEYCNRLYGNDDKKRWLDDFGKLEYVHIYSDDPMAQRGFI